MSDCILHDFDEELCSQAIWNIQQHLVTPRIREAIDRLPALLIAAVLKQPADPLGAAPMPLIVLNDEELSAMADAVRFMPIDIYIDWRPITSFYRTATLCTGEIRRRLAPAEASKWAENSSRFAAALQDPQLDVAEGIDLTIEWTEELRMYLEAMGEFRYVPRPNGQLGTPTLPGNTTVVVAPAPELAYLDRLRDAIARHEDGKQASPDTLIKLARVNRQQGRRALRVLEKQGAYRGFERAGSDWKTACSKPRSC